MHKAQNWAVWALGEMDLPIRKRTGHHSEEGSPASVLGKFLKFMQKYFKIKANPSNTLVM